MKRMLYRLIAYLASGAFFAAAGWLVLLANLAGESISIAIFAALAVAGLASSWLLLNRAGVAAENGIPVNSPWNVVAMDGVCIIAATIVSLFIIDGYAMWHSAISPLLGSDPYAMDVVHFMYLPSALVLALFVTSTGSQTIAINEKELSVSGAFGRANAMWNNIEKLSPDEQYVVVSRIGIPIPRHLRTNLEITTNDGDILTVYQPGSKSTAREILDKLNQFAPPRLRDDLQTIETAWL